MASRTRYLSRIIAVVALLQMLVYGVMGDGNVGQASAALLPPSERILQTGCQPRPGVRTEMVSLGENRFSVTVTAGLGALVLVRFGNAPMARLDLPGQAPGLTPPFEVKPPDGSRTYTFQVRSTDIDATLTLPLTIYDGCGFGMPWSTFVGGGQSALKVGLSIADTSVTEGDDGTQSATFTVRLSAPASRPVTVGWATDPRASSGPADVVAARGVVSFAPGEISKDISVQVLGNRTAQATRSFTVSLSSPTNAVIARGTATGTIFDNDVAPLATATSTVPPTATRTPVPTSTRTPAPTSTRTPAPTSTRTPVPTVTATGTASPTFTPTQTETPSPTATSTASETPTATATATDTATPTATETPTATATETPSPTATATNTHTATPTATDTATPTATDTATPTPTATETPTPTATETPSPTATATATATATFTHTATPTATPGWSPDRPLRLAG